MTDIADLVIYKLGKRLGSLLVFVLIVLAILMWRMDRNSGSEISRHQTGTIALAYDARAQCAVDERARPIVLDSGLVDGRGIAAADHKIEDGHLVPARMLYVADAWEGVYGFEFRGTDPQYPLPKPTILAHTTSMCPSGYCERAEYGGLIVRATAQRSPRLVLSDGHRRQLLVRRGEGVFEPALGGAFLRSVSDVTWVEKDNAYFVVDSDSADIVPASNAANSKRSGEVAKVPDHDDFGKRQTIISDLQRPVGIAWSPAGKRLYVADIEGNSEVWSYYRETKEKTWQKAGALWRQSVGPFGASIRLQDMVVADFPYALAEREGNKTCVPQQNGGEVIVAAGADGIYLLHSDGSLLAKYYLGRPVAGLTWGPGASAVAESNWLYFTSGPQIGALKTRLKPFAAPAATTDPRTSGNRTPEAPENTTPTIPNGNDPPPRIDGPPKNETTPASPARTDSPPGSPPSAPPTPTVSLVPPELPIPDETEVLFKLDEDIITLEAGKTLQHMAAQLNLSAARSIVIEGHADSTGSSAHNADLSRRRAQAVERWLKANGLRPTISIYAHGEDRPRDTNATKIGRQRNRRAIITVAQLK